MRGRLGRTYIQVRAKELTPGALLSFAGQGFGPAEELVVSLEDGQGRTEARLASISADQAGDVHRVELAVPRELAPGEHTVRVTGSDSRRGAQATFQFRPLTPRVRLSAYALKPDQALAASATGFAPNEPVDVLLAEFPTMPLATGTANPYGSVVIRGVKLPAIAAGDYTLRLIGRQSQTPFGVGIAVG